MAATSWKAAGKRTAPAPRATVMRRASSGWRSGSRTFRRNSGSSSMKRTPRCASVTSPGRIGAPPPRSAASEIVQCGARTGRALTSGRPSRSPATEWIAVTSIASSSVSPGRIDGRRRASIVLPEPGGPMSSSFDEVPTLGFPRTWGRHVDRQVAVDAEATVAVDDDPGGPVAHDGVLQPVPERARHAGPDPGAPALRVEEARLLEHPDDRLPHPQLKLIGPQHRFMTRFLLPAAASIVGHTLAGLT